MTETEWLACTDPQPMLEFLAENSERKFDLLGVSAFRRVWKVLPNQVCRETVEVLERFADGNATEDDLSFARRQSLRTAMEMCPRREDDPDVMFAIATTRHSVADMLSEISEAVALANQRGGRVAIHGYEIEIEEARQCELVRDVFGNPFRPVTIDPRWQTSAVVDLARTFYDERAFDRMPILADALMDAGCDNEDILNHCGRLGEHVRGCWVVDLLLGKE